MKLLIIDNEEPIRKAIVSLVLQFCPEFEEIKESDSVENGLVTLSSYNPDVLLLDVELGDGTGMDLLSRVGRKGLKVIFITAHDKYAVNAFRYSALDFLLKPINPDELVVAIGKAKQAISNDKIVDQLNVLKTYLSPQIQSEKKIVLRDHHSIYFVKIEDIVRCEASASYTTFYLSDGEEIVMSRKLKDFEEILNDHSFIRVHQSHLVNAKKIKRFDRNDGGFLVLESGTRVPVSQRKKDYVLTVLGK